MGLRKFLNKKNFVKIFEKKTSIFTSSFRCCFTTVLVYHFICFFLVLLKKKVTSVFGVGSDLGSDVSSDVYSDVVSDIVSDVCSDVGFWNRDVKQRNLEKNISLKSIRFTKLNWLDPFTWWTFVLNKSFKFQ